MAKKGNIHSTNLNNDFSEVSTSLLIKHLSAITDTNEEIIKACNFDRDELVDVFDKAVHYFNEITEISKKLDKLPSSYTTDHKYGGDYRRSYNVTHRENSVKAIAYHARLTEYSQSLTRLANSITTTALLRANR